MAELKPIGRAFKLRGFLVEYGANVLGPLPNIVAFQFNPEEISRSFAIPEAKAPEPSEDDERARRAPFQAPSPATESFEFTAHFAAAPRLGAIGPDTPSALRAGVGPQLAALEQMVYPHGKALEAQALRDAMDELLVSRGEATRPMPPETLPRLLFIWGANRILPVTIKSMSITEQKFDALLNPVLAEVSISLKVVRATGDAVGSGAYSYTQKVKERQQSMNLSQPLELGLTDLIRF